MAGLASGDDMRPGRMCISGGCAPGKQESLELHSDADMQEVCKASQTVVSGAPVSWVHAILKNVSACMTDASHDDASRDVYYSIP